MPTLTAPASASMPDTGTDTRAVATVTGASADRRAPLVPVGDDYASSVSHELRTPIAIILGYTEILQSLDAGPLTDPQRAFLDKIERSTNRVLEIMQSVLRRYPDAADSEPRRGPTAGPRDPSFAPDSR